MGLTEQETSLSDTPQADRSSGLVLLPSHLFFVRRVALPTGISGAELASFVEVSLEQISPFALNQLYYGYFLPPGEEHLLMFAAYRKQLAVYEDEEWAEADLVLPDFASVLGLEVTGPTVVFLQDQHEVTVLYWGGGSRVPERVLSRRLELDADGGTNLERVRDDLRRKIAPLPGDVKTVLLERSGEGGIRDKNLAFELRESGGAAVSTQIERPGYLSMDVRDKAFLHASRKTRRQNRLLWAGVLMVFAAFIALAVFEGALFAGQKILAAREQRILALEPEVARIMEEEQLANRLEELSGERLLPFEMIDYLNQNRPLSVYFTRVSTDGLRAFELDAVTPKSQDVDRYQRILEEAAELEAVEIRSLRTRPDGRTSFSVGGSFREGALTRRVAERIAASEAARARRGQRQEGAPTEPAPTEGDPGAVPEAGMETGMEAVTAPEEIEI